MSTLDNWYSWSNMTWYQSLHNISNYLIVRNVKIGQTQNTQKAPHTSPFWASYGTSFVSS